MEFLYQLMVECIVFQNVREFILQKEEKERILKSKGIRNKSKKDEDIRTEVKVITLILEYLFLQDLMDLVFFSS